MSRVLIFFAVFTTVYGLMNGLVLYMTGSAYHPTGWYKYLLRAWFLVMVFAPGISVITGYRTGLFAVITYFWFGLVFYLFLGSVLLIPFKMLGATRVLRYLFSALLLVSAAACIYGIFEARYLRIKEVTVSIADLAKKHNEVRIAMISDIHLYSVEAESRLDRVLQALDQVEYDLLISGGDLIEGGIHRADWRPLADKFARLKPKLGKFAVNGNHELYANMAAQKDISSEFHQAAGFKLLLDQVVEVEGILRIIGLNDRGHNRTSPAEEKKLLEQAGSDLPVILLKHQPRVEKDSISKFDLMLSGHTHQGQLWPFSYIVKHFYPYISGYYDLGQGSRLYTSAGTGVWGPPIRVSAPPEITLIHLVTATGKPE